MWMTAMVALVVQGTPDRDWMGMLLAPGLSTVRYLTAVDELQKRKLSDAEVARLVRGLRTASHSLDRECLTRDVPLGRCATHHDPCVSAFGLIFRLVANDERATKFIPAALRTLDEQTDWSALPTARRILKSTRHPRLASELQWLVQQEDPECRAEALELLEGAREVAPEVALRLEQWTGLSEQRRRDAAEVISGLEQPWATHWVARALRDPEPAFRYVVIHGLAQVTPELEDPLAGVAQCDPVEALREEARRRLGEREIPFVQCPPLRWFQVDGGVSDGTTEVRMQTTSTVQAPSEACVQQSVGEHERALGMVGDVCIIATNEGEFGGSLEAWSGGKRTLISSEWNLNPVALVARGNEVLVVSRLAHLISAEGWLGRLGSADGGFQLEWVLRLDAFPVAWGATRDEVFIRMETQTRQFEPRMMSCSDSRASCVTYAFARDGGFSLVRGPATKCLER